MSSKRCGTSVNCGGLIPIWQHNLQAIMPMFEVVETRFLMRLTMHLGEGRGRGRAEKNYPKLSLYHFIYQTWI